MHNNPSIISFAFAHPYLSTILGVGTLISAPFVVKAAAPIITHLIDGITKNMDHVEVERRGVKIGIGKHQEVSAAPQNDTPPSLPAQPAQP